MSIAKRTTNRSDEGYRAMDGRNKVWYTLVMTHKQTNIERTKLGQLARRMSGRLAEVDRPSTIKKKKKKRNNYNKKEKRKKNSERQTKNG